MVSSKRDVQLQLLSEIDEICSNNNLKYIVIEQKGLYDYNNTKLKDDDVVAIAMTSGDIDRFCQIFQDKNDKSRYVEGMFNNYNYQELFVSYGNINSTQFDIISFNRDIQNGIHIRIYPIQRLQDKTGSIYNRFNLLSKEKTFRKLINKRIENEKLWYLRIAQGIAKKLYYITGGSKRFYSRITRNIYIDKWENIQDFPYVRIIDRNINSENLKRIERINIDGVEISFPENHDKFFSEMYNKDFKEGHDEFESDRIILDTKTGYNKIINETDDVLKEARSLHEEIVLERQKVKNESETIKNIWRLVQMTDKQIEFQQYFNNLNIDFQNLDLTDESQFNNIHKELDHPIMQLKKYAKFEMTFSINPKIDTLIKNVLLIDGEDDLVRKIEKISKKEYFIE